jgi:hypothetical protein
MRRVTARNGKVFQACRAWLEFIRDGMGRFLKGRRQGSIDFNLARCLTIFDLLGSSRIFEQLLDVTGDWLACYNACVKIQFTKTLRKVGVYREGVQILWIRRQASPINLNKSTIPS